MSEFEAQLRELVREIVREELERQLAEIVPEDGSPWLTLDQAADRLACSVDAVRMRVKRGRLEARHHGRRVYVSRSSVDEIR